MVNPTSLAARWCALLAVGALAAGPAGCSGGSESEPPEDAPLVEQLEELPSVFEADTVTILATDPVERTLDVDTRDGPRRYRVTDETRIRTGRTGGETLAFSDLEPGERVAISGTREGEAFVASHVVLVAAGPEPDVDAPDEE